MLLDTCAVLWFAFDRNKLSADTLARIERAECVYISTMSFWEIGVKVRKGKLNIPLSPEALAGVYAKALRVTFVAPELDIVLTALALNWDHADPVDRLLVATSVKLGVPLVTADTVIARFHPDTIA
jgi:PIN domain nuclease of toxin-antitoxin system